MMRYFIQLSFQGTHYHGWQVQANAHSVQAELNKALAMLTREKTETTGCGRTDTGVHAKMFFAHFDAPKSVVALRDTDQFIHRLNCILPNDIAVQALFHTDDDAHARFDALSRTYEYHLYSYKDPFLADYACFIPYEVNVDAMNDLCELLTESHVHAVDYSCFSKNRTQTKTNNCKITEAHWKEKNDVITFRITADRFLRNMVRAIVGTMLQGGKEKLNKTGFRKIIEAKKRSDAGFSVPAHGLYLTDVKYPYKLKQT
jgi:tRNA pseudouridine38-40 synthase